MREPPERWYSYLSTRAIDALIGRSRSLSRDVLDAVADVSAEVPGMDFPIDCALFLRLTECRFGEYGLYKVTTQGVRARRSDEEIVDFVNRFGGFGEEDLELKFIQNAKLDFPTTAVALLAWQELNNDFAMPEWFHGVVSEKKKSAALVLIDAAERNEVENNEEFSSELQRLKNEKRKPGDWYPVQVELREVARRIEAIVSVRKLIAEAVQTLPAKTKRRRLDRMAEEIDVAKSQGKKSTKDIMDWLRSQAGKQGSCVRETLNDGVKWLNRHGDLQFMSMKNLRKREYDANKREGLAKASLRTR